jgi:hypothetical protein
MLVFAFAAGASLTAAISWWAPEEESPREFESTPLIIEQQAPVIHVGPVTRAPVKDSRVTGALIPNPFQRVTRAATPDPRVSQRAWQASMAAYVSYDASPTYAPVVTREWVRKLRNSCARQEQREKAECERVADLIERMLADTKGLDAAWVSTIEDQLQRLFGASTRAKDFSLHEVTCNANGCILYWHSSDYADWQGAGNVLLRDLLEDSGFAEFDLRRVERLGEFDPTTSIPWEMLVLERKPAEP